MVLVCFIVGKIEVVLSVNTANSISTIQGIPTAVYCEPQSSFIHK